MATIILTTADDAALRAAVAQANANGEDDTITFAPELAGQTIRLNSTLIFNSENTTTIQGDIDGDGASDITISGDFDGDGASGMGDNGTLIAAGATGGVTLQGLTLADAYRSGALNGGVDAAAVIYGNGANVTLRDLTIRDAVAIGTDSDGTTRAGDGATILLTGGSHIAEDVLFENIEARGGIGRGTNDGGRATAGIQINDTGTSLAFNDLGFNNADAFAGNGFAGYGDAGSGGSAVAGIYSTNGRGDLLNIDGSAAILISGDTSSAIAGQASGLYDGVDGGALLGVADPGGALDGLRILGLKPTSGDDTIEPTATALPLRILGFAGDDLLASGLGDDAIKGGAGNDLISGGLGNDSLLGGSGEDTILAEGADFGNDVAQEIIGGGTGDDTIVFSALSSGSVEVDGGAGIDLIDFSEANFGMRGILGIDRFFNGRTDDTPNLIELRLRNLENIIGSALADDFLGTDGANRIDAGAGADLVATGAGDDVVLAGDGADTVLGGFGDDLLIGGAGDDLLSDQFGQNFIDGGDGADQSDFDLAQSEYTFTRNDDDLILTFGDGRTTLRDIEAVTFAGGDIIQTAVLLADAPAEPNPDPDPDPDPPVEPDPSTGPTQGNDTLFGTDDADFINALAGSDSVRGGGGNDTIRGESGADTIRGGDGDDTLKGNGGADRIIGQGDNDRIVGGGGDDTLVGSNGEDKIFGRGGNDIIRGGPDNDLLLGNGGNDTLRGNADNDIFSFKRNDGDDLVRDYRQGEDMIQIRIGANNFNQLTFVQDGEDVLMSFDRTTVRFQFTELDDFTAADFLF